MQARRARGDGRGVTAVVGVALMVAAVVVLVGGVAVFGFGIAGILDSGPPTAALDAEFDPATGELSVVHGGGDALGGRGAVVVVVTDASTGTTREFEWTDGRPVKAGDRLVIDDAAGTATGAATVSSFGLEAGDSVEVRWSDGDDSAILFEETLGRDAERFVTWRVDPREGLVREYDFESVGGLEVTDVATANGRQNGELRGATVGVPGRVDTAYEFDDSDGEYVALNASFGTEARFDAVSACAWFNTTVGGEGEFDNWALLDFDRSEYFNLYVRGDDGAVGFSTAGETSPDGSVGSVDDLSTPGSYDDANWHLACGVYNGTHKAIYVDGDRTVVRSNPHSGAALGSGVTRFGYLGDGSESGTFDGDRNDRYYGGRIDEVRLYDRALSPSEVQSLYDADTGGGSAPTGDLLLHYPLDESDGATLANRAGDGGDGLVRASGVAVDGQVGDGGAFDGDGWVALEDPYLTDGALQTVTACGWFNTTVGGEGEFDNWALLDFDRSEYFNLYVRGDDGAVGFSTADNQTTTVSEVHDLSTPGSYNDGDWHFACGVYDGSEKRIYVDGELAATAPNPHDGLPLGTGVQRYGFVGDGSEALFLDGRRNEKLYEGRVDELRLYERALSPGEVESLYNVTGGTLASPFVTEVERYEPTLAADRLVLTDAAVRRPPGTNVTVTVLSDPEGDGTFNRSDPIEIDGDGPYNVTGLSVDSGRFRLEVELTSADPTVTPTFSGANLREREG